MPKRPPKVTTRPRTEAERVAAEPDGVAEEGAFAFATCPVCGWRGPGRRSRERARKDLKHHLAGGEHPAVGADPPR